MPRNILELSLAHRREADRARDWERLGFTLDRMDGGFLLADGVAVDFRAAAALVGLSAAPGEAPQRSADPAASFFLLTTPRAGLAPAHPNGVLALRAVVAMAESPSDHAEYLSALTGQREMLATSAGLEIKLDGARLDVLSPPAFAYRFGVPAPENAGFHIAGLVFAVKSLDETEALLRQAGREAQTQTGRLLAGCVGDIAVAFEQA